MGSLTAAKFLLRLQHGGMVFKGSPAVWERIKQLSVDLASEVAAPRLALRRNWVHAPRWRGDRPHPGGWSRRLEPEGDRQVRERD